MILCGTTIKRICYCAPSLTNRDAYGDNLKDMCEQGDKGLWLLDHIPNEDELKDIGGGQPCLLVLDDLVGFADATGLTSLVTVGSHHLNISLVCTVQNPYLKSSKLDLTTLSRNLTGLILFFQLADYLMYSRLNSRLFPEKKGFLLNCLETARSSYNLNYIFVNLSTFANIPRRHICYTGLFKEERVNDSPLVFDLQG